ncbi:hypothetical protein BC938DRAFT_479204 [Jimgerdemannia flammicorona]|uniref:Uncharacterized protein n=1 Tax=Jimgerdemannia flammicorona TaxID=994334 RepID=A0A433QLE7_9FUNG|nr:hypothetical protein BC938DRAFT_479204 [Jimgerdemannia flammicorona]
MEALEMTEEHPDRLRQDRREHGGGHRVDRHGGRVGIAADLTEHKVVNGHYSSLSLSQIPSSKWLLQDGQPEADRQYGPQVLDGSLQHLDRLVVLLISQIKRLRRRRSRSEDAGSAVK